MPKEEGSGAVGGHWEGEGARGLWAHEGLAMRLRKGERQESGGGLEHRTSASEAVCVGYANDTDNVVLKNDALR
jgi:hypothetical protein